MEPDDQTKKISQLAVDGCRREPGESVRQMHAHRE